MGSNPIPHERSPHRHSLPVGAFLYLALAETGVNICLSDAASPPLIHHDQELIGWHVAALVVAAPAGADSVSFRACAAFAFRDDMVDSRHMRRERDAWRVCF
jgi:hypothetical protein